MLLSRRALTGYPALRRSVRPLEIPNYRRWFSGQLVSISGNWMQIVAEMWLVLTLTGSAFAVGLTSALQFLPILLIGAWGGLIADRVDKRKLLLVTQTLMALPALALFGLAVSGQIEAWMVMALVFVRGSVLAIDMPARQSFVIEIVGADRLVGAVGLQSVLIHASRITGPAMAGVLIATGGIEICFLLNALSFAGMIVALRSLDVSRLAPQDPVPRAPGAVREGFRYVMRTPELAIPLGMMAVVGTLAFNFQVLLPLLASDTFGGGAASYSGLVVAMGAGAIVGALATGARERISERLLVGSALTFGAFALVASIAPSLRWEALALVPLGAASVTFAAGVNSTLQLAAEPHMRGRVMALYSIVFLGSTPIGGPITGWISGAFSPRFALAAGGLAALVAGLGAWIAFGRVARQVNPEREGEGEALESVPGLDRGQACEPGASGRTRAKAPHRSARHRGPRSPVRRPPAASTPER